MMRQFKVKGCGLNKDILISTSLDFKIQNGRKSYRLWSEYFFFLRFSKTQEKGLPLLNKQFDFGNLCSRNLSPLVVFFFKQNSHSKLISMNVKYHKSKWL